MAGAVYNNVPGSLGLPNATEVGDCVLGTEDGFGGFSSADYLQVPFTETIGASGFRLLAFKVQWQTSSPTDFQTLMGRASGSTEGVRLRVSTAGLLSTAMWDSGGTLRHIQGTSGATKMDPATTTTAWLFWWLNPLGSSTPDGFFNIYTTAGVRIGSQQTSAAPTGVAAISMASSATVVGHDFTSLQPCDEMNILEIRMYDKSTAPAASYYEDISGGVDDHTGDMILWYLGRGTQPAGDPMASALLHYYPYPGAPLKTINLAQQLTRIHSWEYREQDISEALSGGTSRVIYTSYMRVDVRLEMFLDSELVNDIDNLLNYLRRGGVFSLAEQGEAAYAGFALFSPKPGDTAIYVRENLFSGHGASLETTTDDFITLQGPSPKMLRETATVSTTGGSNFGITSGLTQDFRQEDWVLVKDRRFWPWLKLTPDSVNDPILSPNQGRVTWTVDLRFYEPPDVVESFARVAEPFPGSEDGSARTGRDFESRIEQAAQAETGRLSFPYNRRF